MLYIIRGLPGSGKTFLARVLHSTGVADYHFEADQFMVDDSGKYSFNPQRLRSCHHECFEMTKASLRLGHNVVVSNTFTRIWEMQRYLDLGYPTTVIRCEGDYGNTHGVPAYIVKDMKDRFEEYPETLNEGEHQDGH